MSPDLLRKEPTIGPKDDIPLLNDRIPLQWEELSRVLRHVDGLGSAESTENPLTDSLPLAQELAPAICQAVEDRLDDILTVALSKHYQRLHDELRNELRALIVDCVQEEIAKKMAKNNS